MARSKGFGGVLQTFCNPGKYCVAIRDRDVCFCGLLWRRGGSARMRKLLGYVYHLHILRD